MHRLATIHNVTDDGRNTVPIARTLVRSAKNVVTFVVMFKCRCPNVNNYNISQDVNFGTVNAGGVVVGIDEVCKWIHRRPFLLVASCRFSRPTGWLWFGPLWKVGGIVAQLTDVCRSPGWPHTYEIHWFLVVDALWSRLCCCYWWWLSSSSFITRKCSSKTYKQGTAM